jgi:hypothetical protein
MEKEPQRLPFLQSMGKRESRQFLKGSPKKPRRTESSLDYLWGNLVAAYLIVSAFLILLHEIERSGGLYLTMLCMVLFVTITGVGLFTKRIWGFVLFHVYAVFVGLFSVAAILLSPLAGGQSSALGFLWMVLSFVFGPASLPYFYWRRTEFRDLDSMIDVLALGFGLLLLLSLIYAACSTSPVPKIAFD